MSKYINADELIKDLRDNAAEHFNAVVNSIIIAQPSADVVEVVRCKDCAHGETGVSGVWCYLYASYRCSDSFCDNGERRETE